MPSFPGWSAFFSDRFAMDESPLHEEGLAEEDLKRLILRAD
jgi:hypothetical protein